MDAVYGSEVALVFWLQTKFRDQSEFFNVVSQVFAPHHIFLFFVPIIYSFDRNVGKRILLVAIISEWINQLMKWTLQGERPFWWIHETSSYKNSGRYIQQYPSTCENAPGNPSAHVLCTTAVWYMITKFFLQTIGSKHKNKNILPLLCWSTYAFIVLSVSLSRVYLASHFPHQCLLGLIMGCVVIMATSRFSFNKMEFKHYMMLSGALFSSSILVYLIMQAVGRDPIWAMNKAIKWCSKKDYVSVHTTPLHFIMRYCGFALGMGIALNSALHKKVYLVKFTMLMKISCALLSVCMIKMCEFIVLPKYNLYHMYIVAFSLYVLLAYLFIAVVPFIVYKLRSTFVNKIKI